jgi:putative flavoprotein involved in K+ transport
MGRIDTVVIGGGQAGLAMSRCLSDRGVDHVVFERRRIAERWRSERWESLRLLTPNWQSRLPGFRYGGDDPDGFMTMPEVVAYLERYSRTLTVPVQTDTTVTAVRPRDSGFTVETTRGQWAARSVVIATGYCDRPFVPDQAHDLDADIVQVTPTSYRNAAQLPEGGVLVVGASASGIQLADEIHRSGRAVTLAVGRHTRLPRRYRGKDIMWWLDAMGVFDETTDDVYDVDISRRQPSMQLVGRPDHSSLDLPILQSEGVRLTGKLTQIDRHQVSFADDLVAHTAAADARLARLLGRVDDFIQTTGTPAGPAQPFEPFIWPNPAPESLDLRAEQIRTVLWATGFRRAYPWLHVPVIGRDGEIRHERGVTAAGGLYVLGMHFQRRRKSGFIDGVGSDAAELADHIAARGRREAVA